MKFLFRVCHVVATFLGTACAAENANEYRSALDTIYSDYDVVEATDESQRQRRRSPESFENDILVGDFNFDSYKDFAAILSRKATGADQAHRSPDHRQLEPRVFLAVVCNGLSNRLERSQYQCMPLSDTIVGGFGSEFDLLDLSKWGDFSKVHDAYGNAQCPKKMQSLLGSTLLALEEPFGRCTTFFYPDIDGGYGQCTYCAD